MQAACYGIQNGATLSRAQVKFFKHNDMEDLERLLQEQAAKDKRSKYADTALQCRKHCNIQCKSPTAVCANESLSSFAHMDRVALVFRRGCYGAMCMICVLACSCICSASCCCMVTLASLQVFNMTCYPGALDMKCLQECNHADCLHSCKLCTHASLVS